ncbi:MAG: LysR family transcriptional regulator [Pontibacterium sp.]
MKDQLQYLDVKYLVLFDSLIKTGSVTATAERLDQSQPTVSIWLAQLRKKMDDPLFVRAPKGMLPTPLAQAVHPFVVSALESLASLNDIRVTFNPQQSQHRFTVAMTDASHATLLPKILGHLRKAAPFVCLEAVLINSDTASALMQGEVDLAVGYIPDLDAGFYQQTLFAQDWVCLHSQRLAQLNSLADYEKALHVSIVAGTGSQLIQAALTQHEIERQVVLKLPSFLGLARLLIHSDLVATVPRHIATVLSEDAELSLSSCPLPVEGFQVKQHWHARFHHDPANQWLRAQLASLFQSQS